MPPESMNCPNCGAPLPDAGGRNWVICTHCGSYLKLDSEQKPAPPASSTSSSPPRTPEPELPRTVADYGRPAETSPDLSELSSLTLKPGEAREIIQLLREKRRTDAIQLYQARAGGTIADAVSAVEAIEAGLQDASAPPPAATASLVQAPNMVEVQALLRRGNRMEAIKRYRELTGVGLRESLTAIEGMERNMGLAGAGRTRTRTQGYSGARSCLSIALFFVMLFICIAGGCGVYLQTKPIYACSINIVKREVVRKELIAPPVQAGYLVFSPGFEESSGLNSWHLSADYFAPVWGSKGFGLAIVSVAASSTGSNAVSAQLLTPDGSFQLRNWGSVNCPGSD